MFDATYSRSGVLTQVVVTCPDEAAAAALRAQIGRVYAPCNGLTEGVVKMRCNRAELPRVQQIIKTASASAPVAPTPVVARTWVERRLVGSDGLSSQTIKGRDGSTLRLTGYGRPFIGGEIDGPNWGLTIRYAYYA